MKIKVTKQEVIIEDKNLVSKGEYNANKCLFEFSEEYDGLTKKAIFKCDDVIKEVAITLNECIIPYEVLDPNIEETSVEVRVYAYETSEENLVLRYSPNYDTFLKNRGSYIDGASESEEVTPSQFEQYSQKLNEGLEKLSNIKVDANKEDNKTTISITNQNNETESFDIFDGETGPKGENATINGYNVLNIEGGTNISIDQDGNALKINNTYDDSNIKKNIEINTTEISKNKTNIEHLNNKVIDCSLITETGSKIELNINSSDFKMNAILKDKDGNVIDTSNEIDLPLETMVVSASYDNDAKELVITLQNGTETRVPVSSLIDGLINNTELDNILKSYIKNTDYPTDSKGGVIKQGVSFKVTANGVPQSPAFTYPVYLANGDGIFISKGTLENVLAEKIGSIDTILDSINGEVI